MTTEAANKTALETVELLEFRLRRIEFLLTGSDEGQEQLQKVAAQGRNHGLSARLASLENNLARLSSKSAVVRDLLTLCKLTVTLSKAQRLTRSDAAQSDLFPSANLDDIPTTLSIPEIFAIIRSSATSYPTTASRLTSIQDLPIPSAESSAALIALQPRVTRLELLQESQGRELAELRLRSAAAIKRWYELGVLGGSECWTEWEGRVTSVEKLVRREEGLRARELEANEAYKT